MKKGWEAKQFEDCIEQVKYTRKIQRRSFRSTGKFPIVSQEAELVNGYWDGHEDVFKVQTPVVIFGDHTQVLKYVDFDFVLGADGVKILQPRSFISPKFFYYHLQAAELPNLGYARHYRLLKEINIPLPPLPEQRRIVGLLDEAFAAIATAKANAEKNLQNAREIFESHLNEVFAKQWESESLVALEELTVAITDGDHMPPPKSPIGVPFITIGNIAKETRVIDFRNTFMVPRSYFNALKANKKPRKGDVLYTVTGSYGSPVLLRDDVEFCFQRHIGLVRPKPETNSSWLYYLLMSPQVFKQAEEGATGTAQRTVSLKLLRSFLVPRMSQKHQEQAVKSLDSLSAETRRLAAIYTRKLAALEELKQALLHRAFSGEL